MAGRRNSAARLGARCQPGSGKGRCSPGGSSPLTAVLFVPVVWNEYGAAQHRRRRVLIVPTVGIGSRSPGTRGEINKTTQGAIRGIYPTPLPSILRDCSLRPRTAVAPLGFCVALRISNPALLVYIVHPRHEGAGTGMGQAGRTWSDEFIGTEEPAPKAVAIPSTKRQKSKRYTARCGVTN